MTTEKDPPLEVLPDGGMYRGVVIDLAGVRVRLGQTPWRKKTCEHLHIMYSPAERRVWCEDCERTIDSFDAFLIYTRHLEQMLAEARLWQEKANEAMKATTRSRAAKKLDRYWRGGKMAPCCPHCSRGLLPEDFADGAGSAVSADLERARRKRAVQPT